jgi:predicted nicotinamide N-methyase
VSLDRANFIRTHTELAAPPLVPEVRLHLATEVTPLWLATEAFLEANNLPPPYWAFAWVGGQALTRWLLDNPEQVRGKRVLDFAAGCGLSAIGAALGGADRSEAAEIDAFSIAAIQLNAAANQVAVDVIREDIVGAANPGWDLVVAGDVCYERPMAERVFAWFRRLAAEGTQVLMADPGRSYLPQFGLLRLATYQVPCSRDLEDRDMRDVGVYRIVG